MRPAVVGGFTTDDFNVDHAADGDVPSCGDPHHHCPGYATFGVACRGCPLVRSAPLAPPARASRSAPTMPSNGQPAKDREKTWLNEYRQHRPMVERTIAWLTRHNRKVRYRGVTRNDHWLHHRGAAVNLRRLITLGLTHTGAGWAIA